MTHPKRRLTDWVLFGTILFGAAFSTASAYFHAHERRKQESRIPVPAHRP